MKRAVIATALLLWLAGCGSGASFSNTGSKTELITWTDGDPAIPVCASESLGCKKSFTVHDLSTGEITVLSVTQTSYVSTTTTHRYEVRTEGYDWKGVPIQSPFRPVPPLQ